MTYSPGSPGYQPAQPPGSYGASNLSFARSADGASRLPLYLQVAVVALGLATYLVSFGPMLAANSSGLAQPTGRAGFVVPLAVLAALLAAVGLLPKAKNYVAIVAVLAALGALAAIKLTLTREAIGWALWLVLAFTVVQAIVAVAVLLLDAGVVTAPAPKPKYDPYAQYGLPPGGGYYGQPSGYHSPAHQQGPQQTGYQSYGGYPSGPSTGGFGAPTGGFGTGPQQTQQPGSPTPPTGFPSFGSSAGGGSATGGAQGQGSVHFGEGQQPPGGQGQQGDQASSSAPSGPTQS